MARFRVLLPVLVHWMNYLYLVVIARPDVIIVGFSFVVFF